MFFKKDILFFIFLSILTKLKTSTDYSFTQPGTEQVLYIFSIHPIKFSGTIENIQGTIEIYCFLSSFIEEDEYGNYKNYRQHYFLSQGSKQKISSSEEYMLISGNGYISFGADKYTSISLDTIKVITLFYEFNNKYYQLLGTGNKLEVSISNPYVYFYFEDNTYCNSRCIFSASNGKRFNIRNTGYSGRNAIIKLLYIQRSSKYSIDEGKGDTIKFLLKQSFTYEISSSLASKYYNTNEGILKITGNPKITFNGVSIYNKISQSSEDYYYIKPSSSVISVIVEASSDEGEITAKGVSPTIQIYFPTTYQYDVSKGIGPQYLRIIISPSFNDNLELDFGSYISLIEGKMFTDSHFNNGYYTYTRQISKSDAGKTFTAVYTSSATFKAIKNFNWVSINDYQVKEFALSSGEEAFFKYSSSGTTLIRFENGNSLRIVNIYIYENEIGIKYDPSKKQYSNYHVSYSSWKEIKINLYSKLCLIIQASESYSDYISFRSDDISLYDNSPKIFNSFNDYNFIGYKLYLSEGENNIDILTNINKILIISLYKSSIEIEKCIEKSCHFNVVKNSSEYYIYMKNINTKLEQASPKLYILLSQKLEYYPISYNLVPKYFLFSFEYKFKVTNDSFISNANLNKEFILNYKYPISSSYNLNIVYNDEKNIKSIKTSDLINNNNYDHYYYNLNEKSINEIIITVNGSWDENLFLSFNSVAFSFGGPFSFNFPDNTITSMNNQEGNIIYFRINNNINNNDKTYLISVPTDAKLIEGKLLKENGELNDNYKQNKKYSYNKDFFKNSDIITVEYNGTDSELYYEYIDGIVLETNNYRQYKAYELNFENNNIIYYLGLYDNKQDSTYGYINNTDEDIIISFKDENSEIYPVLPNEIYFNLDKEFFSLNTQYDLIKFTWKNNNINNGNNKYIKEFMIFDPNLTEENLNYSKQGIFYINKNIEKLIKLNTISDEEASIYRVVSRSYNNTILDLTVNYKNNYNLNKTNNYTHVWEISKGESFNYQAKSSLDALLFSKVLEGSIYKELELLNGTSINETKNNILFPIIILKNSSNFTIEIKNKNKIKFYWN